MRLLFITRKIDKNDPRAGFVSEWVAKLAVHLDKLIIICQEKGNLSGLPRNIEVHSLGKEKGKCKFKQLILFYYFIILFLNKVDGVFSHMMPIYSIIVGPWCKLFGKKLVQWYMHKSIDWRLKLANFFVDEFATASKESFRLKTNKKINILGHGIDTNFFIPSNHTLVGNYYNILTIGRISPIKDYESIIKAVYNLTEQGIANIKLTVVGGIGLPQHQAYLDSLKQMVKKMNLEKIVDFIGPVPHAETLKYLHQADLFINLGDTGGLDKSALEAMASEIITLAANEAFIPVLPAELIVPKDDPKNLAEKIKLVMNLGLEQKEKIVKQLRQQVVTNHNLDKLVKKIADLFT